MEMLYNSFRFTGTIGFNDLKKEENKVDDYGRKIKDTGLVKKEVSFKDGQPSMSKESLGVYIEANGVKQYLKVEDMVFSGDKTFMHMDKDSKVKTFYKDELGSDPKLVDTCMDFLIKKIKIGDIPEFKTLSSKHFLDAMVQFIPHLKDQRVVISGNISTYVSNGKVGLNYEVKEIRSAYENEVDGLDCEFNVVFTKGSVNAPTFEQYEEMEIKKVPIRLMIGVKEKKIPKVFKTNDLFFLDMEGIDDSESYGFMSEMMDLLADGSPMEDMKYYKTKFKARIGSSSKTKELTEEDLTPMEKFSMAKRNKTLEDIKAIRGFKKKSSKFLIVEPINVGGVEEIDIKLEEIFGNEAPATMTIAEAQAMVGIAPTPIQKVAQQYIPPVTPVVPQIPGVIDMSAYVK